MARARNIKPGFYKNYKLADLGPLAQLLFAGLWGLADREGRLEDKPRLIKVEIFPYYDCDVNGELTKLEREGFVSRYAVDGIALIQVLNFKKHQTPHNTEKASILPAQPAANPHEHSTLDNHGGLTVDTPKPNDGKTPDSLIPDSLIPDSSSTTSPSGDDVRQCPTETLVDLYHELMPLNPQVKVLNQPRKSAIKARWLEASKLTAKPFGYTTKADGIEAWRKFFIVCADSPFLTGRAPATPGKPAFVADIDFLFSPSGFARTLENKYHRETL